MPRWPAAWNVRSTGSWRKGRCGEALLTLLVALEAEAPDILIVDMFEHGLDDANHRPPFRASLHQGGPGYEALATCLAAPATRARTAGIVAVRADASG